MSNLTCECNPCQDGDPTVPQHISCQGKVNNGLMKMVDYYTVCRCKKTYITISNNELERLQGVWKNAKYSWSWRSKSDPGGDFYVPEFYEHGGNNIEESPPEYEEEEWTVVKRGTRIT